jgi:hypothetical protein
MDPRARGAVGEEQAWQPTPAGVFDSQLLIEERDLGVGAGVVVQRFSARAPCPYPVTREDLTASERRPYAAIREGCLEAFPPSRKLYSGLPSSIRPVNVAVVLPATRTREAVTIRRRGRLPALPAGQDTSPDPMTPIFAALLAFLGASLRSRASMQLEILALRHQLAICQRSLKRPRLRPADRLLWAWLDRLWPRWRKALVIVQPRTVIAWQRRRFRNHWTRLRSGKPGATAGSERSTRSHPV